MFTDLLRGQSATVAAELRPPRAGLDATKGIDAWIDAYHGIRRLTRQHVPVFVTDSAVGTQEENNLRHLHANLGRDLPRDLVVPFLTSKHSLEFCVSYAEQAWQLGFTSLVILGGDKTVGRPRCVEHAWTLRQHIRAREPRLTLGGWANPHANPAQQVDFLADERFCAEFFLTQVVSHLDLDPVKRFLDELHRRRIEIPGMFNVFYYRSASPKTLNTLKGFMPVPVDALAAEFAAGASPEDVCVRSIRAIRALGVRHVCICNLPMDEASATLNAIRARVDTR
jgi:5,10-methylenetetrahydrofolate reductase